MLLLSLKSSSPLPFLFIRELYLASTASASLVAVVLRFSIAGVRVFSHTGLGYALL